jgi:A/G-specific adenine glycosylase
MEAKVISLKAPGFFSSSIRRQIRQKLLRWFDRHRRDLPWRKDRDPYHIWVSEVMLQQTQVATVLRYYEPFIRAFPSIRALAAATEQAVLRHWEGMGYYRRAINLHQAARQLAADHHVRIPNDPVVFKSLPGVGRYILGAVVSQAFDRRMPIVEANSRRVLSRLLARSNRLAATPSGALWQAAEELLPSRRVGDFNQALMELGALLCTPREPQCSACPLSQCCEARRLGLENTIPGRQSSPRGIEVGEAAIVIRRRNRVLLVHRPAKGRWAGLWEFPHAPVGSKGICVSTVREMARAKLGLQIGSIAETLTLNHSVTRYRIRLTFFEAVYKAGQFRSNFYPEGRWLRPAEIRSLPISAPHRRAASLIFSE